MKFLFNGTLDELKETISIKAKEYSKDIVVYNNNAGTLEIGFKRHGYNSGRFFVANIVTTENEAVILDGETKTIPHSKISSFLNKKKECKYDKEFTAFMSMFTTYSESDSDLVSIQPCWDDVYKKLDLACGKLQSICDDDEDMLRITYDDGMLIDVGYVAEDKTYYITIVASDTAKGRKEPLGVVAVTDKSMLAPELQKAVYAFRNKTL